MRNVRLWRGLLGVDKRTVIEDIEFEEFEEEDADGDDAGGGAGAAAKRCFAALWPLRPQGALV